MLPTHSKIYHIIHVDKLSSVLEDGYLWCEAEVERQRFSRNRNRDGGDQAASAHHAA